MCPLFDFLPCVTAHIKTLSGSRRKALQRARRVASENTRYDAALNSPSLQSSGSLNVAIAMYLIKNRSYDLPNIIISSQRHSLPHPFGIGHLTL